MATESLLDEDEYMVIKPYQQNIMNEVHEFFGTRQGTTLVNGIEANKSDGQVATMYWHNLAAGNDFEIAVNPKTLTQSYKHDLVKRWLECEQQKTGRSFTQHQPLGQPKGDWVTIGFIKKQLPEFLKRLKRFRLGFPNADEKAEIMSLQLTPSSPTGGSSTLPANSISTQASEPLLDSNVRSGRVFVANFGTQNYLWPTCLTDSVIAMFEVASMRQLFVDDDRDGYIKLAQATQKTAKGQTPTKAVASRWFNLGTLISNSQYDIWLHKEGDDLWWTTSLPSEPTGQFVAAQHKHAPLGEQVYELFKKVTPWSNKDLRGKRLDWKSLHPKARNFLTLVGTFHQPGPDHAAYARALVEGSDLTKWEQRADWQSVKQNSKTAQVSISTEWENSAATMAMTAWQTTNDSNGQQVLRTVKNKDFRFPSQGDLENYIRKLLDDQGNECAISGLPLQHWGSYEDEQFLCSLDRIDSSGHYEMGNLQVVCRFINMWKNAMDDQQFRVLLKTVCQHNNVNLG